MRSHFVSALFFTLFLCIVPHSSTLSLYSHDDPLHELDNSNFYSFVLGKSNAWIIEFYNNWCGHCIRFAPTWKLFARDIRTWRNVIDIAVVNCADKQNVDLCREYDVTGYPTIKLFKPYVNESDKGEPLESDRDIVSIETAIVKFLESYQKENAPTDWPELQPLETDNIKGLTNLKDNENSLILFIEHSDSSIGRKVIMDLSFQTSVTVRRVLMTNEDLIKDLKTEVMNSSLATVLKIDKNGNEELIARYSSDVNSTYIRDQIFLQVVGKHRSESDDLLGYKNNTSIKVSIRDSVHMTDLENALRYLLYQEIGVVKHIYGDRLIALKSFIHTLANFFPGKPPVMGFLSKLDDWISNKKNITGEQFVKELDKLQTEEEFLPDMKDFVGCRGSEQRFRGYPCSLWTLFHTLTVQAYITDEETAHGKRDEALKVLPNIKGYIKYFFTCQECVQNFFKMDQNIERDASTSANAVLWLWSAHNRVNHRLSGDLTEDPQHPKVQFPPPNLCPNCRLKNENSDEIKWDEIQVLRFLRFFYSKKNILDDDTSRSDPKARSNTYFRSNTYTSGNSSMGVLLNQYSSLILLWLLHYVVQNMDSYSSYKEIY